MKLIRLSGESGSFQNVFNTDIRVEPNSKIGLLNASILFKGIDVNDDNNSFTFQTKKTSGGAPVPFMTVNLTNDTYTLSDFIAHLYSEISKALSYMADGTTLSENGFQWKLSVSHDKLLTLMWRRGDQKFPEGPINNLNHVGNSITRQPQATPGQWDSFLISSRYMCNGICLNVCRVNAENDLFAFGLVTDSSGDTLEPEDFDYCVYGLAGNYHVISNGTDVNTNETIGAGDDIRMVLVGGNLRFEKNNTLLGSFEYDFSKHYFLGVSILTTGATLNNLQFVADPFMTTVNNNMLLHDDRAEEVIMLGATTGVTTVNFEAKPNAAELLGFKSLTLISKQLSSSYFIGSNAIDNLNPSSLIIETPNLTLESYDGALSRKRPVLCYIPSLNINEEGIDYSPPYPILVNLNNNDAFNLNSIRIRILPNDENTVVDIKKATIVLMIE